jgi:hypothetical protein
MKQRALLTTVLVALCGATFLRSAGFEFVWDDRVLILNNPAVTSSGNYLDLFVQDMWSLSENPEFFHRFWRPLTMCYYRFAYQISGGNPALFHFGSVLLHIGTVALLFVLLGRIGHLAIACFAAALFAVHPLRVESVFWVSGTGDLLCGFTLLLSLYLHERSLERNQGGMLALSSCIFRLALLSKELAFLFPLFLAAVGLLDSAQTRLRLRRTLPYLFVALGTGLVRMLIVREERTPGFSSLEQGLTLPVLLVRYLAEVLLPINHEIHSRMQPVSSLAEPRFLVAVAVIGLAGFLVLHLRKSLPHWLWGWLVWSTLFILPVCFIGLSETLYAERYTYVPAMGVSGIIAVAAGLLLPQIEGRQLAAVRTATLLAVAILTGLAVVTATRGGAWRNETTLYTAMLHQDSRDPLPLYNLGLDYARRGALDEAQQYFVRVVNEEPKHTFALNALGNIERMRGDLPSAIHYYRRAVEADDYNIEATFNLANTLEKVGDCRESRRYYQLVIERGGRALRDLKLQAMRKLQGEDSACP